MTVDDAAESHLEGDVLPKASGGVIRYRIWPAQRHPVRFVLLATFICGAVGGAAVVSDSLYWPFIVALGLILGAGPFFFPTSVGLDGPQLHMRSLGTPRSWDLRRFSRMEVVDDVLPRAELLPRPWLGPADPIQGLTVPLPAQPEVVDRVLVHLRKWVGRRPTGRFAVDTDHAPEDGLDEG